MNEKVAIGIDLGGTKIEIGLVDEAGKLIEKTRLPTSVEKGPDFVFEQIIEQIKLYKHPNLVGIGIGIAGQVDKKTGTVLFAPNLNWTNYPLKDHLEKKFNLKAAVLNDVRAATYGEWIFGSGKGCEDLVCLFVGTGIGSGIVSGGQLLKGCTNTSGEIGHMIVSIDGPLCTCGNRGCFESLAGGWGIARLAQQAAKIHPNSEMARLAGNIPDKVTTKDFFEAVKKKDLIAERLFKEVESALIAGCINIIHAFNPCRLILGGGVIESQPKLTETIKKGIKEHGLRAATSKLEVMHAQLRGDAGVIGSAAYILKNEA